MIATKRTDYIVKDGPYIGSSLAGNSPKRVKFGAIGITVQRSARGR